MARGTRQSRGMPDTWCASNLQERLNAAQAMLPTPQPPPPPSGQTKPQDSSCGSVFPLSTSFSPSRQLIPSLSSLPFSPSKLRSRPNLSTIDSPFSRARILYISKETVTKALLGVVAGYDENEESFFRSNHVEGGINEEEGHVPTLYECSDGSFRGAFADVLCREMAIEVSSRQAFVREAAAAARNIPPMCSLSVDQYVPCQGFDCGEKLGDNVDEDRDEFFEVMLAFNEASDITGSFKPTNVQTQEVLLPIEKVLQSFCGKWEKDLTRSCDQEDLLRALGVPWLARAAIARCKQRITEIGIAIVNGGAENDAILGSAQMSKMQQNAQKSYEWRETTLGIVGFANEQVLVLDGSEQRQIHPIDQTTVITKSSIQDGMVVSEMNYIDRGISQVIYPGE